MTAERPPQQNDSLKPAMPEFILSPGKNVSFYELPGANLQNTKRIVGERAVQLYAELVSFVNSNAQAEYADALPTTPEQCQLEATARQFVEQSTGLTTRGDVLWIPNSVDTASNGQHFVAFHSPRYDATYIKDIPAHPEDLKYMYTVATLAHELTHSTAPNREIRLDLGESSLYFSESLGMLVSRFDTHACPDTKSQRGSFFEEAFAEETAARWRVELVPNICGNAAATITYKGRSVPAKYVDINYLSVDSSFHAIVADTVYPAQAVDLMSQATGVDLYDLMRQARTPGNLASAKRELIATVNSLDPTLYQQLRNTPYTQPDFIAGLELVEHAITAAGKR